jgi:hypothetical protein
VGFEERAVRVLYRLVQNMIITPNPEELAMQVAGGVTQNNLVGSAVKARRKGSVLMGAQACDA